MPFDRVRLTELRLKRKLSMEKLGIEANLEFSDISKIESGKTKNPRFDTVEKLADYFKVNMETFKLGIKI